MTDKIKVTIYGEQTVRYKQVREIALSDYLEYQRMVEEEEDGIDKTFEWLIETSDVHSADEIEEVEIYPVKETTDPTTI